MKIKYPYILERKDEAIRLSIMGNRWLKWLFFIPLVFSIILFVFYYSLFLFTILSNGMPKEIYLYKEIDLYIVNLIFFILYLFILYYLSSNYNWNRKGIETFTLYAKRLEYIGNNSPIGKVEKVYNFETLEITYDSGVDFYSKEEGRELGVESDMKKVVGYYPIRFLMDGGEQFSQSDRKIPTEVIRKVRDEYNNLII